MRLRTGLAWNACTMPRLSPCASSKLGRVGLISVAFASALAVTYLAPRIGCLGPGHATPRRACTTDWTAGLRPAVDRLSVQPCGSSLRSQSRSLALPRGCSTCNAEALGRALPSQCRNRTLEAPVFGARGRMRRGLESASLSCSAVQPRCGREVQGNSQWLDSQDSSVPRGPHDLGTP